MRIFTFGLFIGLLFCFSCGKVDSNQGNSIAFYKIVGNYDGFTYMETITSDGSTVLSDSVKNVMKVVIFDQNSIKISDDLNILGLQMLKYSNTYIENGEQLYTFISTDSTEKQIVYNDTTYSISFVSINASSSKTTKLWFVSE
ncbi:MAG: hypothetical protein R2774_10855 [Saprospiraceae bacterium]